MNWLKIKRWLETAATFLTIIGGVAVVWLVVQLHATNRVPAAPTKRSEPPLPAEPLSLRGAITVGSFGAKVAVIEYSDLQCPFCARFAADTLPELRKKYVEPGLVLFAFKNFPLPKLHAFAAPAAEALTCAADQRRFWEMSDIVFRDQQRLGPADLLASAGKAGADVRQLSECIEKHTNAARVQADVDEGQRMKVTGTPTIFVGRLTADGQVALAQRFSGAMRFDDLAAAVEKVAGRH